MQPGFSKVNTDEDENFQQWLMECRQFYLQAKEDLNIHSKCKKVKW